MKKKKNIKTDKEWIEIFQSLNAFHKRINEWMKNPIIATFKRSK